MHQYAFAIRGKHVCLSNILVQVIWAVKHKHIGDAFFDLDAAAFLCSQLPAASPASQDSPALPSAAQASAACSSAPQPPAESQQQHPAGQTRQGKHLHFGMTQHDSPAQIPSPPDSAALSSAGQTPSAALNPAHTSAQASAAAKTLSQGSARQATSTTGAAEADLRSGEAAAEADLRSGEAAAEADLRSGDAAARGEAQPQRSRHQRRGKQKRCPEPVQPQQISQGSDDKQPAEATIKTQQVCSFISAFAFHFDGTCMT